VLIDLHIHSHISKAGVQEPEEIILKAKNVGLDGVCFVEDQPIREWKELTELGKTHGIAVFFGRLLSADHGDFLFYPANPADAAKEKLVKSSNGVPTFDEIRDSLRSTKGVLAAAHPYKTGTDNPLGDRIFRLDGLDAIQVRNGSCKTIVNDFALEASFHLKVAAIGGSETTDSLATIGRGATLFLESIDSQEELIEALQAGRLWPVQIVDDVTLRPTRDSGGRDSRGGRGGRDSRGGRGGRDSRGGGRGGRDSRGGGRGRDSRR
jgi:predicted metal-dependent phosphoesterase TrpH